LNDPLVATGGISGAVFELEF